MTRSPSTRSQPSTAPSCAPRTRWSESTRRSAAAPTPSGSSNDQAVIRLVGALLSEQNDEWLVQRRHLSVESMALTLTEPTDSEPAHDGLEVPSHTAA